jgi:apolipoprotein N-acyltransferase
LAGKVAVHAAEVGRPAVHAGLSGVSSAFDARGGQLAWYPNSESGVIVVDVPLGTHTTGFQRFGNWTLGMAVSILTGVGVVVVSQYRSARRATRREG